MPGSSCEGIGNHVRHDEHLSEIDQRRAVGKVDRARRAEEIELQAEHRQQAGQSRDEARHAEAVEQDGVDGADQAAECERSEDRERDRPTLIYPQHADQRGGEAADRADRQIDLADDQNADDAERDHADRRAVEQEIDEIVRCQEDRIEALEHRPDDHQTDHDGKRAKIP